MGSERFTMPDLLDYEAQMARDSLTDPAQVITRDRGLRKHLVPGNKTATLLAWTHELQAVDVEIPSVGSAAKRSYDLLVLTAVILGLISGSALIQGLLHYDGTQPVNVIPFLAIYAVLQILFLLNYVFKAFLYRLFKRLPGGALIYLLREWSRRYVERRGSPFAGRFPQKAFWRTYSQRLSQLHSPLLQNHAWKIIQAFGVSWHMASLVTFIALLFFNDYTFGWRTTLQLEPEWLHSFTRTLSLPFAWLGEFATPSLELIQQSQFSRFEKSFVTEGLDRGARATAAWWPFLALVIFAYGLLPRMILWFIAHASIQKNLANLSFNDFQSEAVWTRLNEELVSWSAGELEASRVAVDQKLHQHARGEKRDCIVIRWRDFPLPEPLLSETLNQTFALNPVSFVNARGLAADTDELLRALGRHPEALLVIASDPWELPGEALDKIRRSLRNVNKTKLILFAPLEEKDGKAQPAHAFNKTAWQHAIQAFRDPYLGLLEAGESV